MSQDPPTIQLTATTLNYACAQPRSRLRIFVGIILVLWSIFDLASALFLILFAAFTASFRPQPFAALFLLLGFIVAGFSILAMYCAVSVLKKMNAAAVNARNITTIGEILSWFAALIALPAITYANGGVPRDETIVAWYIFVLICLAIPGAVSITRVILGKLVQQEEAANLNAAASAEASA